MLPTFGKTQTNKNNTQVSNVLFLIWTIKLIPRNQSEVWLVRVSIWACEPNFQVLFNSLKEVSVVTWCSILYDGQGANNFGLITMFLIQFITDMITWRLVQHDAQLSSWPMSPEGSVMLTMLTASVTELCCHPAWTGNLARWRPLSQPLQRPLARPGPASDTGARNDCSADTNRLLEACFPAFIC